MVLTLPQIRKWIISHANKGKYANAEVDSRPRIRFGVLFPLDREIFVFDAHSKVFATWSPRRILNYVSYDPSTGMNFPPFSISPID